MCMISRDLVQLSFSMGAYTVFLFKTYEAFLADNVFLYF